jgi:hypothetical protein
MEYGKPNDFEFHLTQYDADPIAEGIIIFDKASTKFQINNDYSMSIVFKRTTKIKIFSNAGLDYANVEIPFYRDNYIVDEVGNIEAQAYNMENGQKTQIKLDPSLIFEEKRGENIYLMKFAIPNVKPGSIIEYQYTHTTKRKFYLPDWKFQNEIPTIYSEYKLQLNPFYAYTYLLQGANKFDIYKEELSTGLPVQYGPVTYKETILTFGMRDLPAFRDEEFITSSEDYITKLNFQLSSYTDVYGIKTDVITTWPKLCTELLDDQDFGKFLRAATNYANKIKGEFLLPGSSEDEIIDAAIQYVKNNYNWNGHKGYMTSNSLKRFTTEKTGNAAEINLFLCGLLLSAGIEATPLLISTRDHGKIRVDYPFAHYFNYVLVLIDPAGKSSFADATDSFCPNDLIPIQCLNETGLLVEKGSDRWINLTISAKSETSSYFTLTIPSDELTDSMLITLKIIGSKYDGTELRKIYQNKYSNLEKYIEKKGFRPVKLIETENYDELSEPFVISGEMYHYLDRIESKIYISPFFDEALKDNPFKQDSRTYPIDMLYPRIYTYYAQINIPDGYAVESIPEELTMNGKLVQISYKISEIAGNKLIVSANYKYNNAIYKAEDYRNLKFYNNQIIKKFNEKIVLVKKPEKIKPIY